MASRAESKEISKSPDLEQAKAQSGSFPAITPSDNSEKLAPKAADLAQIATQAPASHIFPSALAPELIATEGHEAAVRDQFTPQRSSPASDFITDGKKATVPDESAPQLSTPDPEPTVSNGHKSSVLGGSVPQNSPPQALKDSTPIATALKPEPTAKVEFPPPAPLMDPIVRSDAIKSDQPLEEPESKAKDEAMKSEPYPEASQEITLNGLQSITESVDLATLEAGVATAQSVLTELRLPLDDFKNQTDLELRHWLTSVDGLRAKAIKAGKTIIAVAGGTGTGKSSLINAVLNEERLLPTNGMRACTAVITEVSWNDEDDPKQAYRAEIEYISFEEWESELKLLFDELLDENNKMSSALKDPNSEAAIAYSKVKSVYPNLAPEMIVQSKPKDLAQVDAVKKVLGTKQQFSYSTASALYSNLSVLIDSKEKDSRQRKAVMALWPLIRVVKIFVKADALSTGVVLVDLPGTADSNSARSAVANRYMAECTCVWVVARIERAVDDKAAAELLGRSSRIQMKLDGVYSQLTFIATQTDGIDIRETQAALDEDHKIQEFFTHEAELDAMIEEGIRELPTDHQQQIDEINAAYDMLDQTLAVWESLKKKFAKGKVVFAPAPKRVAVQTKRRRGGRRHAANMDSDDEEQSEKTPLTQDEISARIIELETALNAKSTEADALEENYEVAQSKIQALQEQKANIAIDRARTCVERRNDYCRDAIRNDFAQGIKEIDDEDSAADPEHDPFVVIRDYQEVAQSLSVFCISSKAYQQLRKPASSASKMEGFRCTEDSEIPGLQRHAKESAVPGQIRSNKAFLRLLSQLLNSLDMWSATQKLSLQPGQPEVTEASKSYELKALEAKLRNLKSELNDSIDQTRKDLMVVLKKTVFDERSTAAVKYASKQLEPIARQWAVLEKNGGHGITCLTYRAICKRGGEKFQSAKSRNFNEDLAEPFLQKISSSWEQAFTTEIPAVLDELTEVSINKLRAFHAEIASRPEMRKGRNESLRILARQIQSHEAAIKDAISEAKIQLIAEQRLASRLYLPEIKAELQPVYKKCAVERDKGTYRRMQETMMSFLEKRKSTIFTKARKRVEKQLGCVFQAMADGLVGEYDQFRAIMAIDYKVVFTTAETIEVQSIVRDRVREILLSADSRFDALSAGAEPMQIDQPAETAVPTAVAPNAVGTAPAFDVGV